MSAPDRRQADRGWRRAFASLRHRNYRLYWSGRVISLMGTWMQTIGQAWLVLQLTHSAWQLGFIGALQSLPVLFFSLLGGIFADRWPKRRVLLVTQSVAMVQAILFYGLMVSGTIKLWHIYLLAPLLGLINCLDQPTRSAFVVELVGREDLPNAVALNASLANLAQVVGPGLGGVIIAASGVTLLFLLNALSFLAILVGLALIRSRDLYAQAPGAERRQNTWQSLREGVGYIWRTPTLVLLILVVGLVLLFGENLNVALPLFATDVLYVGATGFGFLSAALSIGSILATLWLAWSNQQPTLRRVLLGVLVFGILEAAFALSHLYPLSLVLIASMGSAEAIFGTLAVTALQTMAPDHLRGRVVSIYVLFFTGSLPLGSLLTGWLTGLCGASPGLLICALLCLLVVGAGWLGYRSAQRNMAATSHPA